MYSRWLSGLGSARNFDSHSRSVAEFARVNPCSGSSSADVETKPNSKASRIAVIAMRRIGAPDFRIRGRLAGGSCERSLLQRNRGTKRADAQLPALADPRRDKRLPAQK